MTTNRFFNNFYNRRESRLAEDLIIEAIKMYGVDVYYMPRTTFNEDRLLGEDPLNRFTLAEPIEAYVNNIQNLDGEGDFLSKFNLEIRDSMKLSIAQRRWRQFATEKLLDEDGGVLQLEEANTASYSNTVSYLLEAGNANGYSMTSSRPLEGDLVYVPFINARVDNQKPGALYVIRFVEHESVFYQHGQLPVFELSCDLFDYTSERLDSGNTQIDAIETRYSADLLQWRYTLETADGSGVLLDEDGGALIQEVTLETFDKGANNAVFDNLAYKYINFSERNPFSEVDRY